MQSANVIFCRNYLRVVFQRVKQTCPLAKARDAGVVRTALGVWVFELNGECYGGYFYWECSADNAYHAKAKGWEAWLAGKAPG